MYDVHMRLQTHSGGIELTMRISRWTYSTGGRPLLIMQKHEGRGCGQPGSRKMAMCFETVLLGCPVTPTEARNGKARPNIKCLGGKVSDSEHFVVI